MKPQSWNQRLKKEREQKNTYFSIHPNSPIPFEERESFKGLNYYPPIPTYRFELELHEHKEKKRVKIIYTGEETKDFLQWGEFRFTLAGEVQVLQVYKSSLYEKRLFVPFRDATSGKETYSAGRYMDLEPEKHLTTQGTWILDFNRAYNPLCAYSEKYTCPFVPPENWLDVPIPAGEKKYEPPRKRSITQG